MATHVIVPPAVIEELAAGHAAGVNLPHIEELEWLEIRHPKGEIALPLIRDLGPGETEVLMLGLENRDAVMVLDDALARRVAEGLGLQFTGTLGVLLAAKRARLIVEVAPLLDRLQTLGFRLGASTRSAVLELAGETR